MPTHIPVPVNNARRAELMCKTWICPAAVGSGFLSCSFCSFPIPQLIAVPWEHCWCFPGWREFGRRCRGNEAHWRGDGPAAGGLGMFYSILSHVQHSYFLFQSLCRKFCSLVQNHPDLADNNSVLKIQT